MFCPLIDNILTVGCNEMKNLLSQPSHFITLQHRAIWKSRLGKGKK